ncbi:xylulokinase [Rhodobacterales bacterium HKCCE3408]|nr:xylulokinase [Rhodobacterales bacterium HKCCE3408]
MYIGLDLGTSGVKALLIDADQTPVADATVGLEVQRPHPGWSEQRPADWVAAASAAMDRLATAADLGAVRGIGLSGQMHGAVAIDAGGDVLRPAILWNDTRAAVEAARMDADPRFRAVTGNIVFPGFTAPKLAWMATHEPELFARVDKVLLPKDYLRYWLTGDAVSEMSDAAGTAWLDTGRRDWSGDLLAATGMTRAQMPRLVEGSAISGVLREDLAARWGLGADVVVAGGGGDNAATGIGVGAVAPGRGFVSLGTSGVLFVATDGFAPDPATAVHTFCHAVPGTWHQMGVILAATDALNWAARLLGAEPAGLTAALGGMAAPNGPTFLPYLGGERTPHNDAAIRGVLTGIDHGTDAAALTRAVLDGVAFAFRDSLDALSATGTQITELLAVGGGARSELWLKIIATALDTEIAVPAAGDFGAALGAARLGLMAAEGAGPEIATPPPVATRIEPDRALVPAYAEAQERYRATYAALKDL